MSAGRLHRPAAAALAAVLAAAALMGGPASPAVAARPYTMAVDAVYRVEPAARSVAVTLGTTFRNTTRDRPGSISLYRSLPIPLQPGASHVTARDAGGRLRVATHRSRTQTLATVTLRAALRYGTSAKLTVAYRLEDRAAPHVRVRPDVVVVPLWAFGTSGRVSVRVPRAMAPSVSGQRMTASTVSGKTMLSSGAVTRPASWQALLTAVGDPVYTIRTRSLALSGGTVDLRVRSWIDDPAWASRTLELATRALPALQRIIGLPYTASTPLVITESLPVGSGAFTEAVPGAQEIRVAFDAAPFAVVHELAHVWLDGSVARKRWIREGFASLAAAQVAESLHLTPSFDPAREAAVRRSAAIALDNWDPVSRPAEGRSAATDAWAYAASWAFARQLAGDLGRERLWAIVRKGVAGATGYRPGSGGSAAETSAGTGDRTPLDSRRFLDLLEAQGRGGLDKAFATTVLPRSARAILVARADARTAYAAMLVASDGWPAPDAIRDAMEAWRFGDAQSLIAAARSWLLARDRLLADARALGLSPPDRLAAVWRVDAGGSQARTELVAERALVDAYAAARASVGAPNPVELLGLTGGPMPVDLLRQASGHFTGGDLQGAAAAIEQATSLAAGAQASGVVRMGIGAALLAVAVFGIAFAAHRLRRRLRRTGPDAGVGHPPGA